MNKHHKHKGPRRYFRKKQVAERYGVDPRTVDRWARERKIPPPVYMPGSILPLWQEEGLDEHDERVASMSRAPGSAKPWLT
jgi:predicted DNA-binding transcriptional regulator AlpA